MPPLPIGPGVSLTCPVAFSAQIGTQKWFRLSTASSDRPSRSFPSIAPKPEELSTLMGGAARAAGAVEGRMNGDISIVNARPTSQIRRVAETNLTLRPNRELRTSDQTTCELQD